MTFVDPNSLPMIGLGRRLNPSTDLSKRVFENEDMGLYELYQQQRRNGQVELDGLTFTGCRIEGPAVMLILQGTTFDAVNFGEARGDIGNMLFRPVRNMAIGTIPVTNCTFVNCEFYAMGFTGNEHILKELLSIRSDR